VRTNIRRQIRLTAELDDALEAMAKKTGRAPSAIVREALRPVLVRKRT
jgi:predicted DNA-binding protein